jgi:hypothetical protein
VRLRSASVVSLLPMKCSIFCGLRDAGIRPQLETLSLSACPAAFPLKKQASSRRSYR